MKKRLFSLLACLCLILPLVTVTAYADCGPKPSVTVNFVRAEGEKYYVTLLANVTSCGPTTAIGPEEREPEQWLNISEDALPAWRAFRDLELEGWYFHGRVFTCEQSDSMTWGYYPPEEFRLAIYFPETDTVVVSRDSYDRYAFSAGFSLDLRDVDTGVSGVADLPVRWDYDFRDDVTGFFGRLVFTLIVEVLLAVLVGYRLKGALVCICKINLVTQVLLNAIVFLGSFFGGTWSAMFFLFVDEIVVLAVEAVLYARRLPQYRGGKGRAVAYAVAANTLSFVIGMQSLNL